MRVRDLFVQSGTFLATVLKPSNYVYPPPWPPTVTRIDFLQIAPDLLSVRANGTVNHQAAITRIDNLVSNSSIAENLVRSLAVAAGVLAPAITRVVLERSLYSANSMRRATLSDLAVQDSNILDYLRMAGRSGPRITRALRGAALEKSRAHLARCRDAAALNIGILVFARLSPLDLRGFAEMYTDATSRLGPGSALMVIFEATYDCQDRLHECWDAGLAHACVRFVTLPELEAYKHAARRVGNTGSPTAADLSSAARTAPAPALDQARTGVVVAVAKGLARTACMSPAKLSQGTIAVTRIDGDDGYDI